MSYSKWNDIKKLSIKKLICKYDELASDTKNIKSDVLKNEMQIIRDEIEIRRKHRQTKIVIGVSIIAVIFSLFSLWVSFKSYSVSEKQYSLNLEPLLNIQFFSNYDSAEYFFKLTNVGPSPIYNIEINKKFRTFSLGNNQYSTVSNKNIWKSIPILKPEDSLLIDVPSDDVNRVIQEKNFRKNTNPQDEGDVLPILYYTFDYIREPDKRKYSIDKYIIIFEDSRKGTPMPEDADNEFLFGGRWRRRLELFEDFDFTSRKLRILTD